MLVIIIFLNVFIMKADSRFVIAMSSREALALIAEFVD